MSGMPDFNPRAYQVELFERAKKQNSILVLGTGSGKTFISILLIKHLGNEIRKSKKEKRKWSVFVVNTVPLAYQQCSMIQRHTPYTVGVFEGSRQVDLWGKQQWEEELENNEVLVIVAKIFEDLLNHSYICFENINLLIFDECHHATGNHPMKEIMCALTAYKEKKPDAALPRIIGMTASVIQKKCKLEDVEKEVKALETSLHATLVSSGDPQAVQQYTTQPKESIVSFNSGKSTKYAEDMKKLLVKAMDEIESEFPKHLETKYLRHLKKRLKNIIQVLDDLGDWFGSSAIKFEIESMEEGNESEEIPALRAVKNSLLQKLQAIHKDCNDEDRMIFPSKYCITEKLKRFLDVLHECQSEYYVLVFVEMRNTAKLLHEYLKTLENEDLPHMKSAYIIGSTSKNHFDFNLMENELRKQQETLSAFSRGDINVLISTSVLEEGIDVRKCNLVIRFDRPKHYSSYVQSRGRARANPSNYILMIDDSELYGLASDIISYRKIHSALSHLCQSRDLLTDLEISEHFDNDEVVPPYEPYPPFGPKITFNSAISLINVYCNKLPQDRFAELAPIITYEFDEETMEKRVRAKISLPINSPLRIPVYGHWMSKKHHAKKSAALEMCKKLHEINELNDEHLRPHGKLGDDILHDLMEISMEESKQDGTPDPGTRRRRQVYRKELCGALSSRDGDFKLYSVTVHSLSTTDITIDSKRVNRSVGLLSRQPLMVPPFSLYSSKWNEVEVTIQLIDEHLLLDPETVTQISHFHKVVFQTLLDRNMSLFNYLPQEVGIFILPLVEEKIDTSLLKHISSLDSLRTQKKLKSKHFNFERSEFEDAVIYPVYRPMSEKMFYVSDIHDDLSPISPFPENKYASYEDYFLSEYGERITNKYQPLLSAKHLPRELNYLKEKAKKKSGADPPKYVPELCGVLPLKASLWWQVMVMPSVLHRLNSLIVAQKLSNLIYHESYVYDWKYRTSSKLNFNWTGEFIKEMVPRNGNLSVILAESRPRCIFSYMILNALTLQGANDGFDGERLEVLGDSFLKFIVAENLFLKSPDYHEGKLSEQRSKLVCNKTLYTLGKVKQIPEKIQSSVMHPVHNCIVPGFVVKPEVEEHLREIGAPHDLWARFGEMAQDEFVELIQKRVKDKSAKPCYNPWTEHELGDKHVADTVEALLGVSLLLGGNKTAIEFLHNLGIGVVKGTSLLKTEFPINSALLMDTDEARDVVQRYYDRNALDFLEKKIEYDFKDKSFLVQAVTHTSFSQNQVTYCYQRLEFLGDAVLDYLVTGMIFSSDKNYNPGQLSDLRSYYVKNETLAKVCATYKLHHHMMYLAPKLQASIDKYLNLPEDVRNSEEKLHTEDDEENLTEVCVPKALGDLVEAIIGAVYLDSGRSLKKTWDVVSLLMNKVIKETLTEIPLNTIRRLYEKLPNNVTFTKMPLKESDTWKEYELQMKGFPTLTGRGRNYKAAKISAAKKGLQLIEEMKR